LRGCGIFSDPPAFSTSHRVGCSAPIYLAIAAQQAQPSLRGHLERRSIVHIINSKEIHVGNVIGSAIFGLRGEKLYELKGISIYRLSGELVGI
jgi:hypothetical protein